MKVIRSLFVPLLFLVACIEPFDAKVPDGDRPLVVDGLITDQPGPYEVQVYRSAQLNNPYDQREWSSGATVTLFDDEGNSEQLVEATPGHYHTATTQGVVGRSYYIQIMTEDGTTYESSQEKLVPVGDFSNLRYTFKENISGVDDNQLNPENGFEIYLDATLVPEQNGLVRWRWTGTFEYETHPELRTKVAPGPVIKFIPDPVPCSGWYVPRGQVNMVQVGACTCCICWANQYSPGPLLSDSRFVNADKINQYYLAFIPANKRYFYQKYYLDVEQMSISESVYEFWKKVAAQQKQGSDLFQTPAPATSGNIKRVSGTGTYAIGIFGASAIKKHSFILYRSDVPYTVQTMDTLAQSCLAAYPNSSTTKPVFW